MKLLTIEQAKGYFIERAKAYEIPAKHTEMLWTIARNIITQAFAYIDSDYGTDAFLETTCNGVIKAYYEGREQW